MFSTADQWLAYRRKGRLGDRYQYHINISNSKQERKSSVIGHISHEEIAMKKKDVPDFSLSPKTSHKEIPIISREDTHYRLAKEWMIFVMLKTKLISLSNK